jgi:ABC-type oligopeptide transport system substrate-binding subunit
MRTIKNVAVPPPLTGRRIYFLAVNHRRGDLANLALRRAIALAINREKLLDDFFRSGLGKEVHRPLNGPYPPGSWACSTDPSLKPDLFDPDRAKAQADEFKKKNIRLSLKYPNDDEAVRGAMEALKVNLKGILGIEIDLHPMPPRRLRETVEEERDYDLAYYHHDYPDETYWLWPLLDARGRNYLGYSKGASLERDFREARNHRNFDRVRTITHTIHRRFVQQEMPFIPLWQLDRHLVVHNDLQFYDGVKSIPLGLGTTLPIDPLRIFSTVEFWKLRRKQ